MLAGRLRPGSPRGGTDDGQDDPALAQAARNGTKVVVPIVYVG